MEIVEQVRRGVPLNVADTGRLIAHAEAAERMGISTRTVRRLVQQRRIRHLRFGRLIRLNVWDIDNFITNATVEPTEEPPHWTDGYLGREWPQENGDPSEPSNEAAVARIPSAVYGQVGEA